MIHTNTTSKDVKRNHKDSIFRLLFNNEEKLLELYNALSNNNYPKGTPIKIITLENAIFGDLKNDLAFIIDNRLIVLIEHQSTVNPNMPIRMFCYLAKQYEQILYSNGIYSRRKIHLPAPEFYVFYNGLEEQPLEQILNLSDSFIEKCDTIELAVKVINVNFEKGAQILRRCQALEEYSQFISMIRERQSKTGNLQAAIVESIQICRQSGILDEFLKRNGGDIVSFLFDALTTEECLAIREEDGYFRGLEEGEVKGHADAQRKIAANFKRSGLPLDVISANTGLSIEEIEHL